jgi:hypothetical protein
MGKRIVIGIVVAGAILAIIGFTAWSDLVTALDNLGTNVGESDPRQANPQNPLSPARGDDASENAIDMIKERTEILDTLGGN